MGHEGKLVQNVKLAGAVSAEDIARIRESGLFDEEWYLDTYPDVRILQMDPVEHYLWLGARLRRDPSRFFSTVAYLEVNPDVDAAGLNPLAHYAKNGKREGRKIARRRRALDPKSWRKGDVPVIDDAPSVLLCAHEVNELMFGGERSFIDMLEALAQMRLNVYVAVPREDNRDYIELLRKKSAGLFSFPYFQWSKNRKPDEISIEDFTHIIEQCNISLVYCNTIVLVDPLIAARRAGRLTAIHARELIDHDEHLRHRLGMDAAGIIARILQQTDYVIANSAATQKLFADSRRSFHVPNVAKVDSLDMPNMVGENVVFGIISSNIPKKGIADFVEVARKAEELVPNARFRVIGPNNDYVTELQAAGLPGNLEFAGYANSPAEAMAQVNVVMALSHFAESFGRTVAEAQAAHRPVIGYRWGAVPELIDDGQTGFLVEYKDVEAVLACVNKLCKEPELIATMGEAGRQKIVRQFAPVVLRNNLRHALSAILAENVPLRADEARRLTIIVPVYNAPDAVERCLNSVLTRTDLSKNRVLMINDGSSDARVQPLLESFARNPGFHLLVNPQNMGYTRTINRGIIWAGADDILLLNSDTIVHDGWIEGMQKIAFGTPKAGTVTAMGDNSGAFSFPTANVVNPRPDGLSHDDWAKRIIGFTGESDPIDVPTGNGFCLYVRRDLMDHIGLFDEEAFPRGYGEENDFCMRTIKAGWKNFISPHAYVFHQRTASFGNEKEGLIKTAMEIVNQRYPDYARKVKAAFGSGRMKALRALSAKAYEDGPAPSPPAWRAAVPGEPTDSAKYRVGPEKRFQSLNRMVIDWHSLRAQAPQRDPDLVSIIVCVYNQYSLTNRCLNALVREGEQAKIEIIMVNNASDEETSGLLDSWAEKDARIRVIHNFDNLNFSLGNNIGFAASHGARVIFLNNDTEVQAGWMEPLLAPLADPEVMGTQPKLLYPDGRVQCVGVVFSGKTPLGYPIYVDEAADSPLIAQNRRFRAITGACLAMRATDFAAVGGFDTVFINGQEDIDLCYRVGHGRDVFEYVAGSTVTHHEGRTKGRGRFISHNRYSYAARWTGVFPGDDADHYIRDGFVVAEYQIDRPELDGTGIACWRGRIEAKT
ncbi:glycosyltransferase [Sphingobium sp. BYY-5]|uniref:glycosyltransferase n=1 Tax=Sphingobium sp. BYY-5 TaxID=2926400 RepID=UPI001FA721C0|nr:glycosyltransferase [Sphingobium sp. BYY-5]MCI4588667.1 glycosyltransferase [Sphingobium sp. BYY-5]